MTSVFTADIRAGAARCSWERTAITCAPGQTMKTSPTVLLSAFLLSTPAFAAAQQPPPPAAPRPGAAATRPQPQMDPERARQLYVSKDPKDHGLGVDFERQIQAKAETDRRYA